MGGGVGPVAGMVVLGLAAGVIGGLFGIGGGLIMVPALILMFGFDVKTATGTSLLAQLLPVGVLGVYEYWSRGQVRTGAGLWIAVGLVIGVLAGAKLAGKIPQGSMKQAYGLFLVVVGLYFLLSGPSRVAVKAKPPIVPGASGGE